MDRWLDVERRLQRKRMPTPKLAAAVTAGTSWKTTGVKTNESRTRFPPAATRAVTSMRSDTSTVATAAPPTTPKGRPLSLAWLRVCDPRAARRPTSTEAQGRASTCPQRSRNGQASRLAASKVNAALPPSAAIPVRQAWLTPSSTAGDQSPDRSIPMVANRAMPGITFGAGPSNACAATCTATVLRLRAAETPGVSSPKESDFAASCLAGTGRAGSGGSTARASLAAAPCSRTAALGSSVTAMMSATASAASPQLRPSTRRTDGLVPALARATLPATEPAGVAANSARISKVPPSSAKRIRGERARTRAIKSARVVQSELASTSSRAAGTGAPGSTALARRGARASTSDSDLIPVLAFTANGRLTRWP